MQEQISSVQSSPTKTTVLTVESSQPAQTIVYDEHRSVLRTISPLVAQVSQLGDVSSYSCMVRDISEDGLFMRIPTDCHISVGHRCEVTIVGDVEANQCSGLIGETFYATVIRSERIELETETVVGVGLRFDQPLYF